MSRYGPPGERPEQHRPPADPWEQPPADSWPDPAPAAGYPDRRYHGGAYQDPGYGEHRSGDPGYPPASESPGGPRYGGSRPAEPGYRAPGGPGYPRRGDPPAPPPRRRPIGLYALVAVLVVLAATGVGYALFLLSGDSGEQASQPPATPGATESPPAGPEATRDNIGMNAVMALVNDCLVNDGTAAEPQMRIVPCDTEEESAEVFQVLEILNERVEGDRPVANERAQAICADTEGYTHHYYEVGESASFVLCMVELE